MSSSIGWVDFDETERDRAQRLMDLFREQDSRDELGLGAIRDSIADHLFPGTSTIHTRLRYMLFIPWIFDSLPSYLSPRDIAAKARQKEIELGQALMSGAPGAVGIIGKDAGEKLKRLPSSIYWSGLESWGIRQFPGSIESYFAALPHWPKDTGKDHVEDDMSGAQRHRHLWHDRMPQPPKGWPDTVDFDLEPDEASFLVDRLVDRHPHSLLTYLASRSDRAKADAIWRHPHIADFPAQARVLVEHARIFSGVMHGAALLYNLLLSELRENEDWIERYQTALTEWSDELDTKELASWSLDDFWHETRHTGHSVLDPAKRFVTEWVALVRKEGGLGRNRDAANALVMTRERRLKKGQSRFANKSARDRWQGASGTGRLQFRWSIAQSHLKDLKR
ncbi:MAG: DUF6361 family protein [Parvularcula sp.]|jgi:hypothetical protein|nr:DUF6361 family protein [Parvularcula sp.]